jgi:drug/metabolite transporter (DMT)-like permease
VQDDPFANPDLQNILSLAAYGLFSQVIGWILIPIGLTRLRSSLVGRLILLQPSLSFTWDIFFTEGPISSGRSVPSFPWPRSIWERPRRP